MYSSRPSPLRPQCDTALAYWNLLLAAFSILGALRIVPHLLWFLTTHSFKETVCTPPERMNGDGASGLWCLLFTLSKLVELVDTMFVCLKGRKPIFLHWCEETGGEDGCTFSAKRPLFLPGSHANARPPPSLVSHPLPS